MERVRSRATDFLEKIPLRNEEFQKPFFSIIYAINTLIYIIDSSLHG